MRAVLTRVNSASVTIDGQVVGKVPLIYGKTVEIRPEEKKKHFWEDWFR